jgi:hypothetical protein
MDSHATESLKKYVGNIGSVLKELSLSKNSDHAYKAKDCGKQTPIRQAVNSDD